MGIQIRTKYHKSFHSQKDLTSTFIYLSNFREAIPHNFPELKSFEPTGANAYRWTFRPLNYAGTQIALEFLTRFRTEPERLIELSSQGANDPTQIFGEWSLHEKGLQTEVKFSISLQIELNLPFLLKPVVQPMAEKELTRIFDTYISNVQTALAE